MSYLLIGSKEGEEWKSGVVFAVGDINQIKNMFSSRKNPYTLWYLIDDNLLSENYNNYRQIDLLFFDLLKKYPDLMEKDYQYQPFVGFYDNVAKNRSWGILKDIA